LNLRLEKQQLREAIWRRLEEAGVARFPLPVRGRIPNFEGAEKAAERVRRLKTWKNAAIVFSNPDQAQKPLRQLALTDGKTLIMASPRLKAGLLQLSPKTVRGREGYASTIKGAFQLGVPATHEILSKVDLVVTGCVAVDPRGFRLGKGGGYGDREISLLRKLSPNALVVTTVHELQLVDRVPVEAWDSRVDVIATPKRIILCRVQDV
jgi:5-formyltetrahydrofolate cyclo-ligase